MEQLHKLTENQLRKIFKESESSETNLRLINELQTDLRDVLKQQRKYPPYDKGTKYMMEEIKKDFIKMFDKFIYNKKPLLKCSDICYVDKDNKHVMLSNSGEERDEDVFFINTQRVFNFFERKYNLNWIEIKEFIKYMLKTQYNVKVRLLIPTCSLESYSPL